jgi:hypothetical protein
MIRLLSLIAACAMLSACATNNVQKAPNADLAKLKTFYVVKLAADERGVEKLVAERLQKSGFTATHGVEVTSPAPVDAIVTYQDSWAWDITMYMIRLNIQLRDGSTGSILAAGESMRPSLQRKSPEGMVEEVLTEILKQ